MAPSKGKETSDSGFTKETKEEFKKAYNKIKGTPEQRRQWRIQSADTTCEECQEVDQPCVSLTGNPTSSTRCERCDRGHFRCSKSREFRKMLVMDKMALTEEQFHALEQWYHAQKDSKTAPNAPKIVTSKKAPNASHVATRVDVGIQVDMPSWTVLADREEDVCGGGGGEADLENAASDVDFDSVLEDETDELQDVDIMGEPQDTVDFERVLADDTDELQDAIKGEPRDIVIKEKPQENTAFKDETLDTTELGITDGLQYPRLRDEVQDELVATILGMSDELRCISDRLQQISLEHQHNSHEHQHISHEHQNPELSLPDQLQLLRREIQNGTSSVRSQQLTRQEVIEFVEKSARQIGDIMDLFGVED